MCVCVREREGGLCVLRLLAMLVCGILCVVGFGRLLLVRLELDPDVAEAVPLLSKRKTEP